VKDPRRGSFRGSVGRQAPVGAPESPFQAREAAIAKIYTRTGDKGETGLFGGERAPKDDPRFEALGAVDELVAHLGVAKAEIVQPKLRDALTAIQGELYLLLSDLGSAKSIGAEPAKVMLATESPKRLEALIDGWEAELPPLKDFVMPGESRASAALHVARTVCRRAERRTITARRAALIPDVAVVYLNRLSDLLFVLARLVDQNAGGGDRTFKSTLA
jgi:cob(I)alamin adenosyltransferase